MRKATGECDCSGVGSTFWADKKCSEINVVMNTQSCKHNKSLKLCVFKKKKSVLGITAFARERIRMGWNKKLSCNAVSMMASIQPHRSPESTSHYCSLGFKNEAWPCQHHCLREGNSRRALDDWEFLMPILSSGVRTSVLKCTVHYIKSMLKIFQWLLILLRIKFIVLWRTMITLYALATVSQ